MDGPERMQGVARFFFKNKMCELLHKRGVENYREIAEDIVQFLEKYVRARP